MKQPSIKAQLLVIFAAILWGTTGSAQALAPAAATPLVIGALRMAIGGSALLLIALFSGSFKGKTAPNKKLLFTAALCMAAYQPLFFSGVSKTGIALGTVLALGSAPIFSGVIAFFKSKQVNQKWAIGTAISIGGCTLLFGGQDSLIINAAGACLSLGAGLAYAIYVQVSQDLFKQYEREAVNGLVFFTAALLLSPLLLMNDVSWILSARGAFSMLHLGLIATALSYTLFAYALVELSSTKAVSLTLVEPLTATILGILVFHETFTGISLIGGLILLCGLIVNTLPEKAMVLPEEEQA